MKKLLVAMLAIIMALSCVSLSACGGNEAGNDEKVKLIVAVNGDATENRLMKKWKEAFETANPNVAITLKSISDNYTQALMGYESTPKNAPDVVWTTAEQHVAWSERGFFINLKSKLENDSEVNLSDFYESMLDTTHKSSSDDGIYFVPRDYNKCVIIINKVAFRNAGYTDEEINDLKNDWDYDKFIATCARLKANMDEDQIIPLDANIAFDASYLSFLKQYGATFVEESGKVDFLADNNIAAYKKIYELIENGYMAAQAKKETYAFLYGKSAMKIDVRPNVPSIPSNANFDIDFLPLPLNHVAAGCSGYAISSVAKTRQSTSSLNAGNLTNEDYAYKFIKFIVSEEGQKLGAESGSIIPVLKHLANDASWTSFKSVDLNHAAFISNPENDFNVNVYRDFRPDDAARILTNMAQVMTFVINDDTYDENGVFDTSKIIGFQNAVKNYTVVGK